MFPDIPKSVTVPFRIQRNADRAFSNSDNIHYDLLRTGSVELTTNKLLERGFLPPVRPYSLTP